MGVSGKSGSGTLHNLLPGVSHTLAFRLPCCLPLILRLGLVVVLRCGPIPAVDRKCLRQDATAIVDMLFVNSGGRSGLDVLQFIREDPGLRHLPIIVLTGFPLNHEVVAEIESRHAELWHKPVDVGHITTRLDEILQAQIVRT